MNSVSIHFEYYGDVLGVETYKVCSVFGHRKIELTNKLKENMGKLLIDLIKNKKVGIFYFGGFGEFDDLCWQIVTNLKVIYPYLRRIYCLSDPRHQRKSKGQVG
ncbi:MAG: hypothetical protein RR400_00570 [Clostridia bacterium]